MLLSVKYKVSSFSNVYHTFYLSFFVRQRTLRPGKSISQKVRKFATNHQLFGWLHFVLGLWFIWYFQSTNFPQYQEML